LAEIPWRCGGLHREGAKAPIWGKSGVGRGPCRLAGSALRDERISRAGMGMAGVDRFGGDPLEMRWASTA